MHATKEKVMKSNVSITAALEGEIVNVDDEAGHVEGAKCMEEKSCLARTHIAFDEYGAGCLELTEEGANTNGMDSSALFWEWRY